MSDYFGEYNKQVKTQKFYLVSEQGDSILLQKNKIIKGENSILEILLRPIQELKPNTTYAMQEEHKEGYKRVLVKRRKDKEWKYWWKTKNEKQVALLDSNIRINYKKVYIYGGLTKDNGWYIFGVNKHSKSEVFYKTEVVDLKTKKKRVFYKTEDEGQIHIEEDVCSSYCLFKYKRKYKIRFTPMNIDGVPLKPTKWFYVRGVFRKYKLPYK